MIYFIMTDKRHVKIGVTSDLTRRIKEIQSTNPLRVKVKAVLTGETQTEAGLHEMFSKHRVHGEWFRLTDEVKWFIRAIQENPDQGNIYTLYRVSQQMRLRAKAKRLGPNHKLSKRIRRHTVEPSGKDKTGDGPKGRVSNPPPLYELAYVDGPCMQA